MKNLDLSKLVFRAATALFILSLSLAFPVSSFSNDLALRFALSKQYFQQYNKWRKEVDCVHDRTFETKVFADPESYVSKVRENINKAQKLVEKLEKEMRKAIESGNKGLFNILKDQAKAMAEIKPPTVCLFYSYIDIERANKITGEVFVKYLSEYGNKHEQQVKKNLKRISRWTFEAGPGLDLSTPPGKVEKPGVLDVVPYGQEGEGLRLGQTPGEAFFEVIDSQFEKIFQGFFKDYEIAIKDCNDAEIQKIDRSIHSIQKALFDRLQRTRIKFKKGNTKWKEFEKKQEKEVLNNIEARLKKWGKKFDKLKEKYVKECKKQKNKKRRGKKTIRSRTTRPA